MCIVSYDVLRLDSGNWRPPGKPGHNTYFARIGAHGSARLQNTYYVPLFLCPAFPKDAKLDRIPPSRHAAPAMRGCHIVKLSQGEAPADLYAECSGLSREALDAVRQAMRRRWESWSFLASHLRSIENEHGLPGLALVYRRAGMRDCRVPSPFVVPFEPTILDEKNEALPSLCGALDRGERSGHRSPSTSTRQRLILRLVLPIAFVTLGVVSFVLDFGYDMSILGLILVALAGGLVASAAMLWYAWQWGQWLIVPGGVLIRRFGATSRCYTPANSTLIVICRRIGFEAVLCRSYRRFWRLLTDLEVTALLAAWASEVAVPIPTESLG